VTRSAAGTAVLAAAMRVGVSGGDARNDRAPAGPADVSFGLVSPCISPATRRHAYEPYCDMIDPVTHLAMRVLPTANARYPGEPKKVIRAVPTYPAGTEPGRAAGTAGGTN
jgi:hypothetical protein